MHGKLQSCPAFDNSEDKTRKNVEQVVSSHGDPSESKKEWENDQLGFVLVIKEIKSVMRGLLTKQQESQTLRSSTLQL